MSTDTSTFRPIPTCDIPMPILEGASPPDAGQASIPRILLQAAGSGRAARRVTVLTGIFLLLALFQLALLFRLPVPEPIVVYGDFPRKTLLEAAR